MVTGYNFKLLQIAEISFVEPPVLPCLMNHSWCLESAGNRVLWQH